MIPANGNPNSLYYRMNTTSDSSDWSTVHDLGLIYLALTHGADAEMDPDEVRLMLEKLQEWNPESTPGQLARVMQDVMLVYVGGSGKQMLETSVATVKHFLPKKQRVAVLNDLADIASADGMIVPGEVSYIQHLARQWEVDKELLQ